MYQHILLNMRHQNVVHSPPVYLMSSPSTMRCKCVYLYSRQTSCRRAPVWCHRKGLLACFCFNKHWVCQTIYVDGFMLREPLIRHECIKDKRRLSSEWRVFCLPTVQHEWVGEIPARNIVTWWTFEPSWETRWHNQNTGVGRGWTV
jgi:hypothetical protein